MVIENIIWVWLIFFIITTGLEAVTLDFVSIWMAIGSLVAFILAVIGLSPEAQVIGFTVGTFGTLFLTRPYMVKYFSKHQVKTNALEVIGKVGVVSKKITPNEIGAVKIQSKEWSAIADKNLTVGTQVEVLEIEGVKLIVKKITKKGGR